MLLGVLLWAQLWAQLWALLWALASAAAARVPVCFCRRLVLPETSKTLPLCSLKSHTTVPRFLPTCRPLSTYPCRSPNVLGEQLLASPVTHPHRPRCVAVALSQLSLSLHQAAPGHVDPTPCLQQTTSGRWTWPQT